MTSLNQSPSKSNQPLIKDFYADATVLVTGGTGFLGKALLVKLLSSCDKLRAVYVLMREKRQQNSQDRFQKWLQESVFDGIRNTKPELLKKLKCVSGDMRQPQLGLSYADRLLLCDRVNIVIHAAASVRFDEPLNVAVTMNTVGTQQVMDLCTTMSHLKSVVYVSTAFTNPGKKFVEEKVYPPVPQHKEDNLMWLLGAVKEETKVQGDHPNTYTLTKSMAENLVRDYHIHRQLPVCIVRPSIIGCAVSEPEPAWVEGMHGVTGFIMELGRGSLQCIMADPDATLDIIPVDYVCNMVLAAAWYNANTHSETINVFHCASGQNNPISWRQGAHIICENARLNPCKQTLWYPNVMLATNRLYFLFCDFFIHYVPAFIYDRIAQSRNNKSNMFKLVKKRAAILRSVEFFTLHGWIFDTKNAGLLQNAIEHAADGNEFSFDVRTIDWKWYTQIYWAGAKKNVMKEDDDEHVPLTLKRLQTINTSLAVMRGFFWTVLLFIVTSILFKLL